MRKNISAPRTCWLALRRSAEPTCSTKPLPPCWPRCTFETILQAIGLDHELLTFFFKGLDHELSAFFYRGLSELISGTRGIVALHWIASGWQLLRFISWKICIVYNAELHDR